jgi:hypothetical protein
MLVCVVEGFRVGLVVDQILDIVEVASGDLTPTDKHGVRGAMVVSGQVTDLLDLDTLVGGLRPRSSRDSHESAAA